MLIDVGHDVVATSITDDWKATDDWQTSTYAGGPVPYILNTDDIIGMEEIRLKTSPTTRVTLSDGSVAILSKSLPEAKQMFHRQ
jgi:hypothetical protein